MIWNRERAEKDVSFCKFYAGYRSVSNSPLVWWQLHAVPQLEDSAAAGARLFEGSGSEDAGTEQIGAQERKSLHNQNTNSTKAKEKNKLSR